MSVTAPGRLIQKPGDKRASVGLPCVAATREQPCAGLEAEAVHRGSARFSAPVRDIVMSTISSACAEKAAGGG